MLSVSLLRGTTAQNLAFTGGVGQLTVDTTLNQLRLHDGVTPGGQLINTPSALSSSGYDNGFINGDFQFWQRGTSQTVAGYGSVDRWSVGTNGGTRTVSRVVDPDDPTAYLLQYATVGGAAAGNYELIQQSIENVGRYAGKTVTISFEARVTAGTGEIAIENYQYFGTGGSPSSNVLGISPTKFSLTTSWRKVSYTLAIPSIAGKTLGTDNNHVQAVSLWMSGGSNYNSRNGSLGVKTQTVQLRRCKIQEGSVATAFEQRPYAIERSLCERYFEVVGPGPTGVARVNLCNGYVRDTVSFMGTHTFHTPKRAAPTIAFISGAATDLRAITGAATYNVSAIDYNEITADRFTVTATISGGTVSQGGILQSKDSVYPLIGISAEL